MTDSNFSQGLILRTDFWEKVSLNSGQTGKQIKIYYVGVKTPFHTGINFY